MFAIYYNKYISERYVMKILFLGTGAADWPTEKTDDMKEYRRLSSAIIDRTLLIDPGPHVIEALNEYGINHNEIKYIINTHKHSDHYSVKTVKELEKSNAVFVEIKMGDVTRLGDYTIYSYKANHSTCDEAMHFIIADSKSKIFYGLDGAWLMYDEVKGIKSHTPDLAVLDATIGFVNGDYRIFEHNNLSMVLEMKNSLNKYIKKFCISHMAYTLHTNHDILCNAMDKENILVAYDGLEIEV